MPRASYAIFNFLVTTILKSKKEIMEIHFNDILLFNPLYHVSM